MALQHFLPLFEVRTAPEGVVEGYASVFGGVDGYGDSVLPGAYAKILEKHRDERTTPVMLWSHASSRPVGKWEAMAEDSRGLRVRGRVNLKTTAGADAYEHLRAGDINGLSIGYSVAPNGAEHKNGIRILKSVDLHEISFVALPADPSARIHTVKSLRERPETLRQFESALQDLGFSRREAASVARKGFANFDPDVDESNFNPPDLQAIKTALLATTIALKGIQ